VRGTLKDTQNEKRRVIKKMKNKMIGIAAVLLFALMLAGVSYALWSKTIYINGYVYTGDVDAEFEGAYDWEAYDETGAVIPPEKKTFTVDVYTDYWTPDAQQLYVDIYDLYPCITVHINYTIRNTGTIPWIVNSTIIDTADFPGTVTVTPPGLIGTQVEPDGTINGDLEVHITNAALEQTGYSFTVSIVVVQWNEYPAIIS
jgi:hypothetical protein